MKKNKMMRLASLLLVMVLMTTCVIGGTFAKYTSTATSSDAARVANWGFEAVSMDLTNLFVAEYISHTDSYTGNTVISRAVATEDVIAPGTSGYDTFVFAYDQSAGTAPEVAYTFSVEVVESIDSLIENNQNIQWKLDAGQWGTWDDMVTAIKNLSGSTDGSGVKEYAPNTLPGEFTANDDIHTIAWQWIFDGGNATYTVENETLDQDEYDTYMGNVNDLGDVSLQITITATQIN